MRETVNFMGLIWRYMQNTVYFVLLIPLFMRRPCVYSVDYVSHTVDRVLCAVDLALYAEDYAFYAID